MKCSLGDPENAVIRIDCTGRTAKLPVNKNILNIGEKAEILEGVLVLAPDTDKAYIPMQAVLMIQGKALNLPSVIRWRSVNFKGMGHPPSWSRDQ